MRKAVHVTTVHPATDNRIFYKECLTLRDAGYRVVLLAVGDHDQVIDGVQMQCLPAPRNRWDRTTRITREALRLCREEDGDIYHFHDPELMPFMARLARAGKPVIYDMHENIVRDMRTKPHLLAPLRPALSLYLRLGMRNWLNGMHVVFAEQAYQDEYPWLRHYTVIENLPRTGELLSIKAQYGVHPALAYLGSVTARRGSLTMLEIVRRLQQEGRQIGLECIGPATAKHRRELGQFTNVNDVQDVNLVGRLEPAVAWRRITGCLAGMALLDDTPNYRNSVPTKLYEYMGLGLPVVTSSFPRYREVVDRFRCGICVNSGDLTAIMQAIKQILDDPEEAAAMGQRGREAVRLHFSWDTEATKLLELYESLMP